MFIDKIFATEFFFIRKKYTDTSKHLYDLTILFKNAKIQKFLNNSDKLHKLIEYTRKEEAVRIAGANKNLAIKDFSYFKQEFDTDLIAAFESMQNTYVLDSKNKISIDDVQHTLTSLLKYF